MSPSDSILSPSPRDSLRSELINCEADTQSVTNIKPQTDYENQNSGMKIAFDNGSDCSNDQNKKDELHQSPANNISKSKRKCEKEEESEQQDVDSGYAWIILAVMFAINASTFGTARAYGLIFEKLARQGSESRTDAALPYTIMGTVENMAGPLTGYLLIKFRSWRATMFIGSTLISLSHLFAAMFNSQTGQVLSIGLMCGVGLSFITISSFQINNAYFVRYRSRAFGLGLTGAAFGSFYISPICQHVLNHYSISLCFTTLSLILFPNVPLSLFLRPKTCDSSITKLQSSAGISSYQVSSGLPAPGDMSSAHLSPTTVAEAVVLANQAGLAESCRHGMQSKRSIRSELVTISRSLDCRQEREAMANLGTWTSVCLVLRTPLFHLIWPTQLLFCWLNFVYGMILVDFGHDRELEDTEISQLIPVWAFGQLVGRIGLGALVDLDFVSYKHLTVICFFMIGSTTWLLNNIDIEPYRGVWILVLVFILSSFIANLYILFNGLVVHYMDKSITALSIGISSFTGSFFLLPRANVIGHYRDLNGNYDSMLDLFTYVTLATAATWLIVPFICDQLRCASTKPRFHLHTSQRVSR